MDEYNMKISVKTFDQLGTIELYDIMALRSEWRLPIS